ncbi:hypothetical protein BHE74_00038086 [Ensete ventricosum]|nr:hypothetical protein BHE74_00038086 [Ensete ventricosum]
MVSRKKCHGHKFCAKSRAESSFDRFFVHHLENIKTGYSLVQAWIHKKPRRSARSRVQSQVSIGFPCTVSEIQNNGHSRRPLEAYEHGFMKKCNDHKLCAKSRSEWSFDRFFVHRLENSKYWPFPTY